MSGSRRSAVHPNLETFRDDSLYPRIVRAVKEILAVGKVVTPVDVLVCMGLLAPSNLEAWRFGRVPYLERVIDCNLTRLVRILRILRMHAHDLKLIPSETDYLRWGGGRKTRLRFSKTGDSGVEAAYARHFVWPGKAGFPLDRLEDDGRPKPSGSRIRTSDSGLLMREELVAQDNQRVRSDNS
jgi:hypothetical protein